MMQNRTLWETFLTVQESFVNVINHSFDCEKTANELWKMHKEWLRESKANIRNTRIN